MIKNGVCEINITQYNTVGEQLHKKMTLLKIAYILHPCNFNFPCKPFHKRSPRERYVSQVCSLSFRN